MFEIFIELVVVRISRRKWDTEFIQYRPVLFLYTLAQDY